MMWEKIEKQERIRESGMYEEKESFITESYRKLLKANQRIERLNQLEEHLSKQKLRVGFQGETQDNTIRKQAE